MDVPKPLPAAKGVFINNRWRPAASGKTIPVVAPAEGVVFAAIAAGDAADVDAAVKAARAAAEGGAWGRLSATERGRLLTKLAYAIADHAEELAKLEARDTGKPMKQARNDMIAIARYFEYYGGAADKVHGDTIPFLPGYFVTTEHVPYGVTAHIIPWNYPAQMFGRTVAPALAMGNACVVKPAEDACLTPLRIAELAAGSRLARGRAQHRAGPRRGGRRGAVVASRHRLHLLHRLARGRHADPDRRGAQPHRLHAGARRQVAARGVRRRRPRRRPPPSIANTMVQNAGQTCSAGSRVLVEKSAYDKVARALAECFAELTAGTPEMDRDLGPVINATQKKRIEGFFARAEEAGVPVLAAGQIAAGVPAGGYFVAPRVYGPVPRANDSRTRRSSGRCCRRMPFDDEADAVRLANGTDYGLMAAVWSHDGNRAARVARGIKAGQVYINAFGAGGGIELPFGGMKKSGHGREKGFAALHDSSQLRTTIHKHG